MEVIVACVSCLVTAVLWRLLAVLYWRPRALVAHLNKQGIYGPPPKLIVGNVPEMFSMRAAMKDHDLETFTHKVAERACPEHTLWSKEYGKRYYYWWGMEPRFIITEPELIREILAKKPSQFEKSETQVSSLNMFAGRGLISVIGDEWTHHRRVVAPAFHLEKLKAMVGAMASSTCTMLDHWETMMEQGQEVEVCGEMSKLTGDVISRTAFGSSYLSGRKIFEIMDKKIPEQAFKLLALAWIPGNRYLPVPANLNLRKLHKEIDTTIAAIIDERRRSNTYGNDLLGLMLKECEGDKNFTYGDLIAECKTFYFAGHTTTSSLLSWSLMLLAGYPEWQERARAEVLDICGEEAPDSNMLSKLKLVGMILNETLRLYPPVTQINRACSEDTWVKDIFIPKGLAIGVPVLPIHHDKELWGEDAGEFNPERFKDGVASACKHHNAFIPFSLGPRVCVGQSFALMEAKVALALILRRFSSFRLSPNYRHNPAQPGVGLKPLHGVQIMLFK